MSGIRRVCRSVLVVLAVVFASANAHGTLTKPIARNRGPLDEDGPSDFQSGNGGGKGFTANYNNGQGCSPCGDGIWGYSNNQGGHGVGWHYRGGDAKDASLHFAFEKLLNSGYKGEYVQGQEIVAQVEITAYHGGHMTFHLCPVKAGELDFDVDECGLLADPSTDAYKKHLLKNASSAELPLPSQFCSNCDVDETPAGFCGYNPGCLGEGPDGFAVFDVTLAAPQVPMDHGVLVWHWFTGNNGEGFVGGEEFMNCADVRILANGSPTAPTTRTTTTALATAPPATTTVPATTTTLAVAPATTASPTHCAELWEKCGGVDFARTCCAGSECTRQSDWYSQCTPTSALVEGEATLKSVAEHAPKDAQAKPQRKRRFLSMDHIMLQAQNMLQRATSAFTAFTEPAPRAEL